MAANHATGRRPRRTTLEVLTDHLEKRCAACFEDDLHRNYAEDVAMLVAQGVYRGHDGARSLHRRLHDDLPNPTFRYTTRVVNGEVALLEWTAEADGARVDDGADSFLIRDGRIVAQTIHYTVRRR